MKAILELVQHVHVAEHDQNILAGKCLDDIEAACGLPLVLLILPDEFKALLEVIEALSLLIVKFPLVVLYDLLNEGCRKAAQFEHALGVDDVVDQID